MQDRSFSSRDMYFDKAARRVVFVDKPPDAGYWDARWQSSLETAAAAPAPLGGSFITRTTERHLPEGSRILEGGCGNGMHSRHLHEAGFAVTSVDWAPTTIDWLREHVPQINPVRADLRDLPFPDGHFDGYWSLGVIEHFYDGYQPLLKEMRRVIRPGGFLFLTFPYMSPLRRLAGATGRFRRWEPDVHLPNFHQFALPAAEVEQELRDDFEVIARTPMLAITGMEGIADSFASALSRNARRSKGWRVLRSLVERTARPVSSHMIVLVLHRR